MPEKINRFDAAYASASAADDAAHAISDARDAAYASARVESESARMLGEELE